MELSSRRLMSVHYAFINHFVPKRFICLQNTVHFVVNRREHAEVTNNRENDKTNIIVNWIVRN